MTNDTGDADTGVAVRDTLPETVEVTLTPCLSESTTQLIDREFDNGFPEWLKLPVWSRADSIAAYVSEIRDRTDETGNRAHFQIDQAAAPEEVEEIIGAYLSGDLPIEGDDRPYGMAEPTPYLRTQLSVGEGVHSWDLVMIHDRH